MQPDPQSPPTLVATATPNPSWQMPPPAPPSPAPPLLATIPAPPPPPTAWLNDNPPAPPPVALPLIKMPAAVMVIAAVTVSLVLLAIVGIQIWLVYYFHDGDTTRTTVEALTQIATVSFLGLMFVLTGHLFGAQLVSGMGAMLQKMIQQAVKSGGQ